MGSLKTALSMERSRLFVGRDAEVGYVRRWLHQPTPPTEMVFVSGMGGIGKSALLLKFLSMAHEAGVLCIWLDSRSCPPSPSGLVDALHTSLFPGPMSDVSSPPLVEIVQSLSKQRTLLCIDNYEHLNQIEGWLREFLLPELPASELLLVLASRQQLSIDWYNDIAWRNRVKPMQLEPLSLAEARAYYSNVGVHDGAIVENMLNETRGYPLAMALAADRVTRTPHAVSLNTWPVGHVVSSQLLREVSSPHLHEALDVLCILPQATQGRLNRLIQVPITASQFHHLSQLSFVRPTVEGIALHDVARTHLLEDFLRREPERYQRLRRRIVAEVSAELSAANPHEKSRIAATLLALCRDAVPLSSQFTFSANPVSTSFDVYRREDLEHLHRLLEEEEFQKAISLKSESEAHQLLDELANRFPESIRVFRSAEGIPLVFHAGLLLYQDTWNFLDPYIPQVLEACFPTEAENMSKLRHEEADTYFHFIGAADHHNPNYPFNELYGFMFTDGFARSLGVGIRLTTTTHSVSLIQLFTSLGYEQRRLHGVPSNHPAYDDFVFDLDLRTTDFGEWVKSFLDVRVSEKPDMLDSATLAKALRDTLDTLGEPSALERTAVARWLHCTGDELQDMLRKVLNTSPPPSPLSPSNQVLLRLLSSEPYLNADVVAARLHMSRATYYRHLRDALEQALRSLAQLRHQD